MALFEIRFITCGDFISDAIRDVTNSEWSHVEIIMPDGSYTGAHNPSGVQNRPANYCVPTRERRYAIPVLDTQLGKMTDFLRAQIGKPYDRTDIAGLLLHRDWHDTDGWICSELVAAVAEAGGLSMLNAQPQFVHKITPEMLHLSPHLIGRCTYSAGV